MRIIVGITGATGAAMGFRIVELLNQLGHEAHVVISRWGAVTLETETGRSVEDLFRIAAVHYENTDMAAAISSGSYPHDGMIVVPCSMKTLAGIACGYTDNLITRAADVCLKERRKLVLVTRETPLNSIHLRNMLTLSEMGATIMPPVLAYYSGLENEKLADAFLGRALSQFGIENSLYRVWHEES